MCCDAAENEAEEDGEKIPEAFMTADENGNIEEIEVNDVKNKAAAFLGEGVTIPFMSMLGQQYPQAQFVITGVLGPHSNAHGPNEFLHLDYAQRLTCCVAEIIAALK